MNAPNVFPQGYLVQADDNGKVQFVYQPMPWRLEIASRIMAGVSTPEEAVTRANVDDVVRQCFVAADKLIAEHERPMGEI